MNKKLGIVITDGVGFRNFVMSNFLAEASLRFDEIIIYSSLPKSAYTAISLPKVTIKELAVFEEGKLTWFFRKWKELAHLQRHASFYGMKDNLVSGYPKNNTPRALLVKFLYGLTRFMHSDKSIIFAEKLQFLSFSNHPITKEYKSLLQEDQPNQVFFTHQRPPFLAPFLVAAMQLKIPAGTFIFSWDNLASKGRMLGTFDYFLVWSDLMKKELRYFYPKVKNEAVMVVGTPQFEPYVMPKYETTKEDFIKKFQLDDAKKTICYSCADVSIGKNDPLVIAVIANAIRNQSLKGNVQLMVRTSPAEDDARFKTIKETHPEIKWNVPKWLLTRDNHAESWSQRIPSEEDIKDLRAVLTFVDLNVNMCSTMSLDFMLFNKPVINTVFGNETNGLYNDQRFLHYDHYKKVVESGAVVIAKNENELVQAINEALQNPEKYAKQRKEMIALQISKSLEGTSKRLAETLFHLYD